MKIRKNITISDTMLDRGDDIAKARGFDDFSEMVSALIREEYERRGLAATAVLKESSTPASSETKPAATATPTSYKKKPPHTKGIKPVPDQDTEQALDEVRPKKSKAA